VKVEMQNIDNNVRVKIEFIFLLKLGVSFAIGDGRTNNFFI
jgi:hypothetical protein